MDKQKVLVLGSEGLIGKPLCNYLRNEGHYVWGIDKKVHRFEDLGTPDGASYLNLLMPRFDKVIFLAFEVGGSKFLSEQDKDFKYIDENVKLMTNTFSVLAKHNKPFLFASSQMSNMHNTNYGFLKDLGERYTRSLENGWICKFWNVYGEENVNIKSHVITDFISMAQKDGVIKMRTDGSESRQFLYVTDCSRAIAQWVDGEWDDIEQSYDITSFKWHTVEEVARIISHLTGCTYTKADKKDTIQAGKNTPNDYIRKFWSPRIPLKDGITRICFQEQKC